MSDEDDLTISEVRALLGTTRRDARWHLTDELDILCLFARARFDLRQVETTGNDVVEVTVTCAFGSVDFVVPDGTMVVLDGTSFLASARSDVSAEGDSELPRIEITATTVLGRVKIISPTHDDAGDEEVVDLVVESAPAPAPVDEVPAGDEPTPAPAVAQAPANKYAAPADDAAATEPAVAQAPANKYAAAADDAAEPAVAQAPANKYAAAADESASEDGAAA
ncbi:MAG: hypothetical protein AAGA90_16470 [Actinomycetota bacterium]